ncbi:MAG: chromosome partitioning protein [Gammaproteobacteria bacterium]|nr:chromosome partitioning protein [Gammaproteobacteria bacterium]|tara:strand:+ start:1617 stop:2396 length:780 start_codon:yes stop_codon:yes gene_type:complete
MTRIIAITNQKGGVGKTTTCVNLGATFSEMGYRVLVVDFDPQGNTTSGSGVSKHVIEHDVRGLLQGESSFREACIPKTQAGYDLLPSDIQLTEAEVGLISQVRSQYRLKDVLKGIADAYDFVLIDCPPALSMLTVNGLIAADGVIVPVQCEFFALEGLAALMETIDQVRATHNADLVIDGVLRTMYDPRTGLTRQVSQQLEKFFGDRVFKTVIPRNVRLAEAPSHGLPVLKYDRLSKGALSYLALAAELRKRLNLKTAA